MSEGNVCSVCRKPSEHKCGACRLVFYCGREHQICHWKEHAPNCQAFKLAKDETLGRHYIARKKIAVGQLIFQDEEPLIAGPPTETCPVCLNCYIILAANNAKPCEKCGWPLCKDCEQHGDECQFTTQYRPSKVSITYFEQPHPTYRCVIIIRALALRQTNLPAYHKLMNLQGYPSNMGINRERDLSKNVALFMKRFFKIDHIHEDEILRISGIIQINAHEVPLAEPAYIAVYDKASYLEHNCHANSSKSFSASGGILIRAAKTIRKGDHITMCYTDPLWGVTTRRYHLKRTKYFDCKCNRCSDPTEFKTMFNSLKCIKGCCGTMFPPTFITSNDFYPDYTCNQCDASMTWQDAEVKLEQIGLELASLKKNDINEITKFVEKYSKIIHENHFYMVDVKLAIAQMIGQDVGLAAISDELLNEKTSICKKLDEVFKILIPAEIRLRGLVLYEIHAVMAEFGRRQGRDELRDMIMLSYKALQESYQLLRHESDVFPEGKIARVAEKNLREIENILKALNETISPG